MYQLEKNQQGEYRWKWKEKKCYIYKYKYTYTSMCMYVHVFLYHCSKACSPTSWWPNFHCILLPVEAVPILTLDTERRRGELWELWGDALSAKCCSLNRVLIVKFSYYSNSVRSLKRRMIRNSYEAHFSLDLTHCRGQFCGSVEGDLANDVVVLRSLLLVCREWCGSVEVPVVGV